MSKRVEALAEVIVGRKYNVAQAITLIDAELRKERELAAERFRVVACPLTSAHKDNAEVLVYPSCAECRDKLSFSGGMQYCTEVTAILAEEED